jgi:hypothetical protein
VQRRRPQLIHLIDKQLSLQVSRRRKLRYKVGAPPAHISIGASHAVATDHKKLHSRSCRCNVLKVSSPGTHQSTLLSVENTQMACPLPPFPHKSLPHADTVGRSGLFYSLASGSALGSSSSEAGRFGLPRSSDRAQLPSSSACHHMADCNSGSFSTLANEQEQTCYPFNAIDCLAPLLLR